MLPCSVTGLLPPAAARQVLCTTSTLAMGVNLPARLVVLKGTRRYVGSEAEDSSGYQEYERSTCLQAGGTGLSRVVQPRHAAAVAAKPLRVGDAAQPRCNGSAHAVCAHGLPFTLTC